MRGAGLGRRFGHAVAEWVLFRLAGRAGLFLALLLAVAVLASPVHWRSVSVASLLLLVLLIVVLPRAAVRRLTSHEAAMGKMHEENQRRTEAAQHERRELSAWVADQVARDRLTGLLNRAAFLEQLTVALDQDNGLSPRAVVVLDLAKFAAFNETHGPAAGDELLVAAAARLASVLRPEDTVARLDGDVFGALLTVPRELVQQVVERVQRAVGSTYTIAGAQCVIHSVCGVVSIDPDDAADASDVLRRAEIALHNAKATARPVVVFEPRLEDETRRRLRFYADLNSALGNDDFKLVYQPIVNTASGRVSGVEALMRWTHPTRGPVSPAEFIPMAEASGQIVDMGLWALRTACRQLRRWRTDHELDLMMSVNLSARQLSEPDVIDRIAAVITRETADPRRIKLEITESLIVEDSDTAIEVLQQLRGLGVRLAIDDFGTGYASLSRLSKLPIDELKIDRYFVAGIGSEGPRETILAASIGMAHGLGLKVVAEGVETPEQLDYLTAHGCDYIQGFLYAEPMAAGDVPRFARHQVTRDFPRQRATDSDPAPAVPAVLPSMERAPAPRLFSR
jgi:diguanylate cyclase (GGDEF)-like protein